MRLAKLRIPGYHCLWRSFPAASARIADFGPHAGGGSPCLQYGNLVETSTPYWSFVMSQPSLDIRLPTYPSELTDGNLKSLGSSGFARHYYRNRCLLSLPRGTKMFQFPRFPLAILCIQIAVTGHDSSRVSPFGDLRIKA